MVAFQGCPIVPPGAGLNVSFVSMNDMICLGVGATPEAVADPYRLTQLIMSAFEELEKIALPKKSVPTKAAGKKAPRKKAVSRKTAAKTRAMR